MLNKELILKEIAVADEFAEINDSLGTDIQEPDVSGQSEQSVEEAEQTEPTAPEEQYVIDGEIFTPDQVKEWKQGYLRQSDYTKKTQELSIERQRVKDAIELYDYLQSNPELAQQLASQDKTIETKTPTQENKAIQELNYRLASMELDSQLSNIKAKDPSVDEIQLLNIATQNNCPLDTAYNIYRGMNFDKLLEQKLKEQSSNITNEISKNGKLTQTLISSADKPNDKGNYGLSNDEVIIAGKLGMSLEEYSKWK